MAGPRVLGDGPFLWRGDQRQLVEVFDVVVGIKGGDAAIVDGAVPSGIGTAFADGSPALGHEQLCFWR